MHFYNYQGFLEHIKAQIMFYVKNIQLDNQTALIACIGLLIFAFILAWLTTSRGGNDGQLSSNFQAFLASVKGKKYGQ